MALPDVKISYAQGMGRREPSQDGVSGLVGFSDLATPGKVYKFISPEDAKLQLGAQTEAELASAALYHIERFFVRNASGTLYFVGLAATQTGTVAQLLTQCDLLREKSRGQVRQIGVMLEGYAANPTLETLLSDVVPQLNAYAQSAFDEHQPCIVLVEGYGSVGTNYAQMLDLRSLASPLVSVVIANTRTAAHLGADIGDLLGVVSRAKVNESVGWIEKFQLQDKVAGLYLDEAVWNKGHHSKEALDHLHTKGYILARQITGIDGYVFNSFPTCAALNHDWAWAWGSRTALKASRLVYPVLARRLESPLEMQPDGTIHPVEIGNLEALAYQALQDMLRDKEASVVEVVIDPTQAYYENQERIKVRIRVVPFGIARGFDVTLSLTAKLN